MPHHARCVSSFRLGIKISSGCGKVFPGASLPGRLSLLAGLRPASPGPAVLIRGDDPPDPHDRGWGWFCHWRRDGPRTPTIGAGVGFAPGGGTDPRTPTTGARVGFATGGGTAPRTPTTGARVGFATGGGTAPRTPTVPGLCCGTRLWLWPVVLGRRWLAVGDLPLAVGRTPPEPPDVRAAPSQATPLRAVSCCFPSPAAGVCH